MPQLKVHLGSYTRKIERAFNETSSWLGLIVKGFCCSSLTPNWVSRAWHVVWTLTCLGCAGPWRKWVLDEMGSFVLVEIELQGMYLIIFEESCWRVKSRGPCYEKCFQFWVKLGMLQWTVSCEGEIEGKRLFLHSNRWSLEFFPIIKFLRLMRRWPTQTNKPPNHWNITSARQHLNERINSLKNQWYPLDRQHNGCTVLHVLVFMKIFHHRKKRHSVARWQG